MLDQLVTFAGQLGHWGYLVNFIGVALECQVLLGLILFNALGCMVWASEFVSLGYLAGETWLAAAKWVGRASEIIGGALLLAIALGCLWRWLGRHETDVRQRWQALVEHPRILSLRRRFAPQLEFLLDRLSPRSSYGGSGAGSGCWPWCSSYPVAWSWAFC